MAKLIIVDGQDNSGKSELIKTIINSIPGVILLKFPKKNNNNLPFKIESYNETMIFETMLDYLDTNKIYLLDRGYLSNIIYEKVLRDKNIEKYFKDFIRLNENHDVSYIILTRNKIGTDFKDDLISLSIDEFNTIIDEYENFYNLILQSKNYHDKMKIYKFKILNHDLTNNLVSINECDKIKCLETIKNLIKEK